VATAPPSLTGRYMRSWADQRIARNREHDRSRSAKPWRRWYNLARWKAIRAEQLAEQPLCIMCDAEGSYVPATVCDHVVAHRGDEHRFWNGPFQSLCDFHHNRDKQRDEQRSAPRSVR
jgi:5-methylcytosine-specific restriction protein A